MKLFIAIDGACRRNGKPNCTSAGGVFIKSIDDNGAVADHATESVYEYRSTNQRGELLALLKALQVVCKRKCEAQIVTDSEYLFNSMTKRWYKSWQGNSWLTRDGYEVKNRDIWERIVEYADLCEQHSLDVVYYHIKGHCIPFGAVTATKALDRDPTGEYLYNLVCEKFDTVAPTKAGVFEHASELSVKNNGFALPAFDPTFKSWVTANVVADAVATRAVEEAERHREICNSPFM